MKTMRLAGLGLVVLFAVMLAGPSRAENAPDWKPWNAALFDQAKAEKRFVILDLKAIWCHWCHVMEEQTYANPEVDKLITSKYLAASVDQDGHPELSNRYGDWGWPATIIFAADGSEIVKLRGFVPPDRFAAILKAIIKDPSPGPSVQAAEEAEASETAILAPDQRKALLASFNEAYDEKNGGWGTVHKYIDPDGMDLSLSEAERGDAEAVKRARQTLDAATAIIDPVWGGIYQYSDEDDWSSPHFEKIMSYQASGLRQYSYAATVWKDDPKYRKAADDLYRYLATILTSPEGAFYTSQDADLSAKVHGKEFYALDDAGRRKLGAPHVDQNIYARENGWAIQALTAYSNATGDKEALERAERAAKWIMQNRGLPSGGFRHGEQDPGGPYLGDTLSMGRASIELYAATGQRKWLEVAKQAGEFIDATFKHKSAGFGTTAKPDVAVGVLAEPMRQYDENVDLARFANLLNRYLGDSRYRKMAEYAMRFTTSKNMLEQPRVFPGLLLADRELAVEPAHITIIGGIGDPKAETLHQAARAYPAVYKRLDWWDRSEGPLPNPDVQYPELDEAAAFACANRICSLPVFEPPEIGRIVDKMMQANTSLRQG